MCHSTTICPKGTISLTSGTAVKLFPARCNRWLCPDCGPRKARRLRGRLSRTSPNRFVTLTLKASPETPPLELLAAANRAWSILWRRLRRKWPNEPLGYAKVVELTKAGTPHLHILLQSPYINQRWLSGQWRELTGSFIVDIRKVKSQRMLTGYLTSYLTKSLQVPQGARKWSASNGWVPPEPEPQLEEGEIRPYAKFLNASLLEVRTGYWLAGWRAHGDWMIPPAWLPLLTPGSLGP